MQEGSDATFIGFRKPVVKKTPEEVAAQQ